ncbi:unnamed protein product [Sphagnum balticum]
MANNCSSQDTINFCSYYKSTTYLSFNSYVASPGYGTTGSLTFNPSIVSATNTVHTISAGYPLSIGDYVVVTYYPQVPIPTVCQVTTSNGYCYSYPTSNTIIFKATVATGSYTFSISGMSNPNQYYYPSNNLATTVWRSGYIYTSFYTSYTTSTIYNDPITNNPLSITFVPTLTPNYQLMYTFNNIAKITISYALQNAQIQQIYITSPYGITINTGYCNATMETFVGEALPYPYRFTCTYLDASDVRLNMQSDFPAWQSEFINRTIIVYLKYQILTGLGSSCGMWTATTYTDPTSTNIDYTVSVAQGNFNIVPYQLPYLYVINFPTESFD